MKVHRLAPEVVVVVAPTADASLITIHDDLNPRDNQHWDRIIIYHFPLHLACSSSKIHEAKPDG